MTSTSPSVRAAVAAVAAGFLIAGTSTGVVAAPKPAPGPMTFTPLAGSANYADGVVQAWSPAHPWAVPDGFTQALVSGEDTDECRGLNIYDEGRDDWHDMNTVNETGQQVGRYMYRTHEVRLGPDYPEGGAVSVVDLQTCEARVIAADPSWTALDGIRWTPWGTVLFAEETAGGRLFELLLDKDDPMSGQVYERPAVGLMAHEGIEVGPDGALYVIDEFLGQSQGSGAGGGIYKFVPDRRGDLTSGDLFVLAVAGDTSTGEGIGQGAWRGPIDPKNVRESHAALGGTSYERPEDVEAIGNVLYVAVTAGTRAEGGEAYDGRVLAINLKSLAVTDYVKPGVNVPIEVNGAQSGLDNPDNLAQGPDGRLWIVEDNVPSDIWVAQGRGGTATSVNLFASLTDPQAEGTGIYFGTDPHTLFVNVQHSAAEDGDGTWAITNR